MVVGPGDGAEQLSVPGCPTNMDDSRARVYSACSRLRLFVIIFFSHLSFIFSFSLSLADGLMKSVKYCLIVLHMTAQAKSYLFT